MNLRKFLALILVFSLTLPAAAAESATPTVAPRIEASYHTTLPESWDPLGERTAEGDLILSLTTDPLYRVSDEDGSLLPVMAKSLPQDVTEQHAGTFGIPAGATRGYAFTVDLVDNALWEDGTPVTAQDYLFALETLLMARSLELPLANLQGYYDQDQKQTADIISLADAGFGSVEEAQESGHSLFYVDTFHFWGLDAGWVSANDRTRLKDSAIPSGVIEMYVSGAYLYDRYLRTGADYAVYQSQFVGVAQTPEYLQWEDVGLTLTPEGQLLLIMESPTAAQSLAASLMTLIPVRESLYTGRYATSPDTYSAFGPYRIAALENGEMILEPNPLWSGNREVFEADRIRLTS